MALEQLRAVMNRNIRPKYVDMINQQAQYLPNLYQQKADTAYQDKLYEQNERSLAQATDVANQNYQLGQQGLQLGRDQLKAEREQANKARKLGYANIGLGAATGLANLYQASKPLDIGTPELSNVTAQALPDLGDFSAFGDVFSQPATQAATQAITPSEFSAFDDAFSSGTGQNFFGGVSNLLTDYVVEPLKQFGSSVWDAGSSFLSDIGDLFS